LSRQKPTGIADHAGPIGRTLSTVSSKAAWERGETTETKAAATTVNRLLDVRGRDCNVSLPWRETRPAWGILRQPSPFDKRGAVDGLNGPACFTLRHLLKDLPSEQCSLAAFPGDEPLSIIPLVHD